MEEKRVIIKSNLKAIGSHYCNEIFISIELHTQDFNHKGSNESFSVNSLLFKEYLESELKDLDVEFQLLMKELID